MKPHRKYTIIDRRRVLNLYMGGMSCREVAARTDVYAATVRHWLAQAGRIRTRSASMALARTGVDWITPLALADIVASARKGESVPSIARRYKVNRGSIDGLLRQRGATPGKSRASRIAANDPRSKHGARRIAFIRRAAKLRAEGLSMRRIAEELDAWQTVVCNALNTPLAKALAIYVHGPGTNNSAKIPHAHAMREQGLPPYFIAKVLDVETSLVDTWFSDEVRAYNSAANHVQGIPCSRNPAHVNADGTTDRYHDPRQATGKCVKCVRERKHQDHRRNRAA